eukprot:TRINITY_DN58849_c0_g1_i1.p1 TRINITY_DN58849_c0_g1~~TRINITY_DN58849_c0_g1_i1.p1  ORF type:complete len:351 (-),score=69.69 TRINITY_DN58849_c0_g1_i1:133-1185(-)
MQGRTIHAAFLLQGLVQLAHGAAYMRVEGNGAISGGQVLAGSLGRLLGAVDASSSAATAQSGSRSSTEQEHEQHRELAAVPAPIEWSTFQPPCEPGNTVWDIGMNTGTDTRHYLEQGSCVLAVEADPSLVADVKNQLSSHMNKGALRIANIAIAMKGSSPGPMQFWMSKKNKEWNSFRREVACRTGQQADGSWQIGDNTCYSQVVQSQSCEQLFATNPVPAYVKLDIEGAEEGCVEAIRARKAGRLSTPRYLSMEVHKPQQTVLDLLNAGYTEFKLVRQDLLTIPGTFQSTSGDWGEDALDCRLGKSWRSPDGVMEEYVRMHNPNGGDPPKCPSTSWYDLHARRPQESKH